MIFRYTFFDFPGRLKTLWMKPLELQGFNVIADQVETYTTPDGIAVSYCSGEVRSNEFVMGVVGQPGEGVIGFLLGVNIAGNEPFLDTVTRVLFASGAKITRISRHVHCKNMFLAQSDDSEQCLNALTLTRRFAQRGDNIGGKRQRRSKNEPLDLIGTFTESSITIQIFAGQGFDVNASEKTFYIALDYKKRLLQSGRHLRAVISKINNTLVSCGMQPVELLATLMASERNNR